MADDTNEQVQTPEQVEAAKAQAETDRKAQEQAELAKAISRGVVEGLAARSAAERKQETAATAATQEQAIEEVDPAEIDRRIKAGEPVADLLAKFGRGVEERTRRSVIAETGAAVGGLQEVVLNTARKEIEHFTEYEDQIQEVVARVTPGKRTLKVYQEATAMVLGRPENRKKLVDAELALALSRNKPSAGAAETGGATRVIRGTGSDANGADLAPTEDNISVLFGQDAHDAFVDLKRSRDDVTLDSFAKSQGYSDAKAWFKRAQENDRRYASEGSSLDK